MKHRTLSFFATLLATSTWVVPAPLMGEERVASTPVMSDVATPLDVEVTRDGLLSGTTVDPNGAVLANAKLSLLGEGGDLIHTTTSDEEGRFELQVDRGGTYEIVVDGNRTLVRCWAAETAPPNATPSPILRVGPVARGQIHPAVCSFANPWVITGLVTAAIVIPIAIHNNRDDRESASP